MKQSKTQRIVGYVVLILFLLLILLPFYWMVVTSFKSTGDISAYPPSLFPKTWTFEHYQAAFGQFHFGGYMKNSLIVALITTVLVLTFASMAGFSIARLPIRGKKLMLIGLLIISVFPPIVVISPLYMILRTIGWLNSYQALIVPYTAFNLPFAIWILRNYFMQVPGALFEAAKVDGANVWQTYYRIFLPVTRPGMFTAAVFTFVAAWTEFFMSLVFNVQDNMRTIPVGIALFSGQYNVPYGDIFAASVVSIIPIIILVILFRKWIVSGLTAGAVKG